jgi:hypothetical protein
LTPGSGRVVEAQRKLGFGHRIGRGDRFGPAPGEVTLGNPRSPGKLAEHLQRRHARAVLDSRDVCGRAPGERDVPLTQGGPLASFTKAFPDGGCVVDVSMRLAGHRPNLPDV